MTKMISGDWFPGAVPDNVVLGEGVHIETAASFSRFRSRRPAAASFGDHSSAYVGCMFDLGPDAELHVGPWTLLNGLWVIADACVSIGSHGLISWNVVVMDTYRASRDAAIRREQLKAFARSRDPDRLACRNPADAPRGVIIEDNVWIGFDCCILPGVRIGAGSVIGARSVVACDIPPNTLAAGNPARIIRTLVNGGGVHD